MYEMFLGPVEQSKPWDTNGIDGVHRFIKKFWSLFYDRNDNYLVTDEPATKEELKSLHKLIKKVTGDIEQFSYNTSISAFMICVNELFGMKCSKKEILNQFIIVLAPFAPHVCEELWETLGNAGSVCDAKWPVCNEEYLVEDTVNYTVSFNGKARFNICLLYTSYFWYHTSFIGRINKPHYEIRTDYFLGRTSFPPYLSPLLFLIYRTEKDKRWIKIRKG